MVARIYGAAMLSLARQRGEARQLDGELVEIVQYLRRDDDFARFLSSPMVDTQARKKSLETLLRGRGSDLLVDTLQVLNAKGRLELLPAIAETYHQALQEEEGILAVRVRSAVPLDDAQRRSVRAAAASYSGKEVELEEEVDAALIGGLVLEIGDQKIDGSVRGSLARLRDRFTERAAQEILSGSTTYFAP
jgi:F-type H+-transporting ATPase subunit delta